MNYQIDLDEYRLAVEVTHCVDVKPDPNCRDSDHDYYGYREMEFTVVSGVVIDEGGAESNLGRNGCAALAEKHAELIEELIWKQIEEGETERRIQRWEAA
ncbi:hypothetical protein [Stutzerimonas nitrititolerans]|uniref:hypothetical protein n=1 Tax=Stutzerimonas nitrititolerans TaxID=2482751 RepID=UPI0028AD4B2E|nr:hypothetical protein [Stutzerimonas nitrititolerans]